MEDTIHPHNLGKEHFRVGEAWFRQYGQKWRWVQHYQIMQTTKNRRLHIVYGDPDDLHSTTFIDPKIIQTTLGHGHAIITGSGGVEGVLLERKLLIHKCEGDC